VGSYVLRRLVLAVPVLFGVSIGVFLMIDLVPGDPATVLAGDTAPPEQIELIRHELGLDQPLPVQYALFLERLLHGSLGTSIRSGREVMTEILDRFPYTLELTLAAITISTLVGVSAGVWAAVNRGRGGDHLTMGLAILGLSIPSFWTAILMVILFSLTLHWLPVAGAGTWQQLVMPALALSLPSAAVKARITRASMLEILGQDYLRTARAKGLRERVVVLRHALKNALIPIVTLVGIQVGAIIEGAFITETVFSWPGIGRLAVQAIPSQDYPVVQGVVLVSAISYMLSTLVVDLLYAWLDPRISYVSAAA